MGRKLAAAREAVLAGTDGWGSLVKSGIAGNLIHRIELSKFRNWVDRVSGRRTACVGSVVDGR